MAQVNITVGNVSATLLLASMVAGIAWKVFTWVDTTSDGIEDLGVEIVKVDKRQVAASERASAEIAQMRQLVLVLGHREVVADEDETIAALRATCALDANSDGSSPECRAVMAYDVANRPPVPLAPKPTTEENPP